MTDVAATIDDWVRSGESIALATVVATKRSAPQPVGTKMAVAGDGRVAGAVSGGCVEGAVVEVAEGVLAGGEPQLLHYGIADEEAWDVGLPCGGEISVWVESLPASGLQAQFTACVREGRRAAMVTALQGAAQAGAKLMLALDESPQGTLGDPRLDSLALDLAHGALWSDSSALHEAGGALLFVDVAAPPPRLIIVGAVDFAAALSALAALTGWRAYVVDPRERFATRERFPAAEEVIVAWPQEAFERLAPLDPATAIAVLTHDPKLDDAALGAALQSGAGYIGAMGSRRAQARRRERLLAAGIDAAALDRIHAPIGLDLGALTAAETALSILGEIVAVRHGREGGRLGAHSGRIHAEVGA